MYTGTFKYVEVLGDLWVVGLNPVGQMVLLMDLSLDWSLKKHNFGCNKLERICSVITNASNYQLTQLTVDVGWSLGYWFESGRSDGFTYRLTIRLIT